MEYLLNRIDRAEKLICRIKLQQAPTAPIYDPNDLPEDAVTGQIAVGSDVSFNWFDGTSWHTKSGTPSITGNVPQDSVDGQIVIGSDNSFHWFIDGTWYTAAFAPSIVGNVPQDVVTAQIAIGVDSSFHWYDGTTWQSFT